MTCHYTSFSSSSIISFIFGLTAGCDCRHPRIRARNRRFVTIAICWSRLSGSGNCRLHISQRRTPKLYTSTWNNDYNKTIRLKARDSWRGCNYHAQKSGANNLTVLVSIYCTSRSNSKCCSQTLQKRQEAEVILLTSTHYYATHYLSPIIVHH